MTGQESAADLAAVLRGRRSIDLFEPQPVAPSLVLEAIEVARWAPNHRRTEPWRFYLVGSETRAAIVDLAVAIDTAAKGERVGAARRARLDAIPAFLVLTSRRSDEALLDRENYAACCCAAQNMLLYLWQRGIGSKWTTGEITRDPRFYQLLGADPASESVVGLFWFGVAKVVPEQKRRPVADIATQLP